MKQQTKYNLLHQIRTEMERKIDGLRELTKSENLSSTYLVGKKHGMEITHKAIEKIILSFKL